jgi:hypothetical protein
MTERGLGHCLPWTMSGVAVRGEGKESGLMLFAFWGLAPRSLQLYRLPGTEMGRRHVSIGVRVFKGETHTFSFKKQRKFSNKIDLKVINFQTSSFVFTPQPVM